MPLRLPDFRLPPDFRLQIDERPPFAVGGEGERCAATVSSVPLPAVCSGPTQCRGRFFSHSPLQAAGSRCSCTPRGSRRRHRCGGISIGRLALPVARRTRGRHAAAAAPKHSAMGRLTACFRAGRRAGGSSGPRLAPYSGSRCPPRIGLREGVRRQPAGCGARSIPLFPHQAAKSIRRRWRPARRGRRICLGVGPRLSTHAAGCRLRGSVGRQPRRHRLRGPFPGCAVHGGLFSGFSGCFAGTYRSTPGDFCWKARFRRPIRRGLPSGRHSACRPPALMDLAFFPWPFRAMGKNLRGLGRKQLRRVPAYPVHPVPGRPCGCRCASIIRCASILQDESPAGIGHGLFRTGSRRLLQRLYQTGKLPTRGLGRSQEQPPKSTPRHARSIPSWTRVRVS